MSSTIAPPRPPAWEERLSSRWFRTFSPPLQRLASPPPPERLAPFVRLTIERRHGPGTLAATWYPAPEPARGAVLLLHPWHPWGQSYFHRQGRIAALREAGYHTLTVDMAGFGDSARPSGFPDREIADAVGFLRRTAGALPLHLWGVSGGGSWAHLFLSGSRGVQSAMFEDVPPHLIAWSLRAVPRRKPAYLFFRHVFHRSHRFLDARLHAAALAPMPVAYVSGERDPGVAPEETRELARLSGGRCLIVPRAGHLVSFKLAAAEMVGLALATFRSGETRAALAPSAVEVREAPDGLPGGCLEGDCPG